MKVLLISANTEKISMPTLAIGLGCVAEATRAAGHEVVFLDLMAEKDPDAALASALSSFSPRVIGISIRNIDDQYVRAPKFLLEGAREMVALCRKSSDAVIVVGGAGYSIFPESALAYLGADMGIQGEGEAVFPLLLDRLEKKSELSGCPGLYLPGSGSQGERVFEKRLDRFPLPDPGLFPAGVAERGELFLPLQTRRGCPLDCLYCSTGTIEGRRLRMRNPEAVVREIVRWREAGFSRIFFVDNTFNLPPSYALDLCREMTKAGLDISWRCILYPGKMSENLAAAMAEAGCKEAILGFESGDDRMLRSLGKHFTRRDVLLDRRILADRGIVCNGFLLLGGPGETRETVEESFLFSETLRPDALKITTGIRIYPYTGLARIAVAEGKISAGDNLLFPRGYLADAVSEWLPEEVRRVAAAHRGWIC